MSKIGITPQQARKMVGDTTWNLIQQGLVGYSRNMKWEIVKAGYLYWKRRCNPMW